MDSVSLGLFLFGSFIGGLTIGLAGFALALVVSGIWLHIITPIQTATLVVGYNLVTQGYAIWKLRQALSWRRVAPFILGGSAGVPIGTILLTYSDPAYLRAGSVRCSWFIAPTTWRGLLSGQCSGAFQPTLALDFSTACLAD
jgi:uncharacterized protein